MRNPKKVLIACEFSGIVREAFNKMGCYAWSCDLLPSEISGNHIIEDVIPVLSWGWDLLIAHPPCTNLAVSGARWFESKGQNVQTLALEFFLKFLKAPIPMICVENPISIVSTRICKPTQIIQPYMFGHGETKATCLWLKGLPKLRPTNVINERIHRVHREPPSKDRWKNRSRTYQGIAEAMASQWGELQHPYDSGGIEANYWIKPI